MNEDVLMPLLSILTPSFNYLRFLPDALRSVGRQVTETTVEHVVVDDGSTEEGVVELLESWPDPLVLRRKENEGQSATLNTALKLARGKWIGWLNADDFYLPGALAEVERLAASDEIDVIHGDTVFVDANGRVQRLVPQHPMHLRVLTRYEPCMHPPSVFVRREVLGEDPWDPELRQDLDWDLWLRLAHRGARFRYGPWTFSAFRRHAAQVSQNLTQEDERENTVMARRFRVPVGELDSRSLRGLGRIEHGIRKLFYGSYRRQWRVAREFSGADLRWFESEDALRRVEQFLARADGRQLSDLGVSAG